MDDIKCQTTLLDDRLTIEKSTSSKCSSTHRTIKSARKQTDISADYIKKISCGPGIIIFITLLSLSASLSTLLTGIFYRHKCNIEKYIPIYLIVKGTFGIFGSLLYFFTKIKYCAKRIIFDYTDFPKCKRIFYKIFLTILGLFLAYWFIEGNMWTFGNYTIVHHNSTDVLNSRNYCHKTCYLFSFWSIIITYAFVILLIGFWMGYSFVVGYFQFNYLHTFSVYEDE